MASSRPRMFSFWAKRRRIHSDVGKGQLRILYAMGPGDVVRMYRDMLDGKEPPFEMSIAFSELFLDWCDKHCARAHLISWHRRSDSIQSGNYFLENLPKSPLYYRNGILHHIGAVMYGLRIISRALQERPNVLIVDSGTSYWILFSVLVVIGIPVIAVMHSTLWPMCHPPERMFRRLLLSLDGLFFRRFAAATTCVSPECGRQVQKVAVFTKGPVYQCRAQFRPGQLSSVSQAPRHDVRPFRVLFVGRVEREKGVFLVVSMAERLEKEFPGQFTWKIVGLGSASESLTREVVERNLRSVVDVVGRLPREQALEAYGWSHATVVPTTEKYSEGLAMTAVEAVLAGRPVVLSTVVPAWEVLGDAAIRAETGDVESFVTALRRLAFEEPYYDRCRKATLRAQGQFYDASLSLGSVLGKSIIALTDRDFHLNE
jgi:glycogen synthase